MTEKQKNEITRLQIIGRTAAEIAKELSLKASTVKSYIHRHPLDGNESRLICKECGCDIPIREKNQRRVFCSTKCSNRWWGKNRKKVYSFTCKYCGKEFTKLRNDKPIYCSTQCYVKDRWGDNK